MDTGVQQTRFNGGEYDPRLHRRSDWDAWQWGMSRILNLVALKEGGLTRRMGTRFVARCVDDAPGRLLPFRRSQDDMVLIDARAGAFRFFDAADQSVIEHEGAPYELAHAMDLPALTALYTWQSADVLFMSDRRGDDQPQSLARYDTTDWRLNPFEAKQGPYLPQNGDDTHTLSVSAYEGAATLTSSKPLFTAAHVGALVRLFEGDQMEDYSVWTPEETVDANSVRSYGPNVYQSQGSATCGNRPPVHLDGIVRDGQAGALWQYLHDGAGLVEITSVASATSAGVTVLKRPPSAGVALKFWAEGAFSNARGWPRIGGIFEERFVLFSTAAEPDTVHLSATGEYTPTQAVFRPGTGSGEVNDNDAVRRTIANGQVLFPAWVHADEQMLIGTPLGVFRFVGPTLDEPISPASAVARKLRRVPGCAPDVLPETAHGRLIYPSRTGRGLVSLDLVDEGFEDLLARAGHIGRRGRIQQIVWQAEPEHRLWMRNENDELFCFTYDPTHGAYGWTRQALGGRYEDRAPKVESLAVLPDQSGRDRLWLRVARTDDAGAVVRTIEVLDPDWSPERALLDACLHLDAAVSYDGWNTDASRTLTIESVTALERDASCTLNAAGITLDALAGRTVHLRVVDTDRDGQLSARIIKLKLADDASGATASGRFTHTPPQDLSGWIASPISDWAECALQVGGASHLNGMPLTGWADGVRLDDLSAEAGVVDVSALIEPAARIEVGLSHDWLARTLYLDFPSRGETKLARKRIKDLAIGYVNTRGGRVRVITGSDKGVSHHALPLEIRDDADPLGQAPRAKNGQTPINIESGRAYEVRLEISGDGPEPFTLDHIAAGVGLGV
ncbi:hypothetical protein [Oceanicaulis sp. MMSF_3324]|uniref:hypothetical protein n=1 Tax=Oceanicaulis sp. MMSF_3324 TaxID=3046702 RepID=UPI00273CF890|nr:hypothetical protein [Oceanicaulis sp. MMSF_3324]